MEEVKQVVENIEDKVEAIMNEAEETTEKVEKAVVDEAQALGVALKEQIKGKVIKVGAPGALVDIGKDKPAVLHISEILRPEGKENCNKPKNLCLFSVILFFQAKRIAKSQRIFACFQ